MHMTTLPKESSLTLTTLMAAINFSAYSGSGRLITYITLFLTMFDKKKSIANEDVGLNKNYHKGRWNSKELWWIKSAVDKQVNSSRLPFSSIDFPSSSDQKLGRCPHTPVNFRFSNMLKDEGFEVWVPNTKDLRIAKP